MAQLTMATTHPPPSQLHRRAIAGHAPPPGVAGAAAAIFPHLSARCALPFHQTASISCLSTTPRGLQSSSLCLPTLPLRNKFRSHNNTPAKCCDMEGIKSPEAALSLA